ncbi:UNVERIFIED_CONTAM: hypothetical protein K2H54_059109 [Gekko kuhli]
MATAALENTGSVLEAVVILGACTIAELILTNTILVILEKSILVSEETRLNYSKNTSGLAPVIEVVRSGYYKVLGPNSL